MPSNLIEKHWDYSQHARFYEYRPNYSPRGIDALIGYVNATPETTRIADIGAGTGNLSILFLERNYNVTAVEPNDEMRNIGIERTQGNGNIQWVKANGVDTTLPNQGFDWVTFGSSFNVMDRFLALQETTRILKPGGFFSCMWNHRDLDDPTQKIAEDIIVRHVPNYDRGVRREEQRSVIQESGLFKDIFYLEVDFEFEQSLDNYILAWRSVKNKYWDLDTPEGTALFDKITADLKSTLPAKFSMKYTTRCWTAQKKGK